MPPVQVAPAAHWLLSVHIGLTGPPWQTWLVQRFEMQSLLPLQAPPLGTLCAPWQSPPTQVPEVQSASERQVPGAGLAAAQSPLVQSPLWQSALPVQGWPMG